MCPTVDRSEISTKSKYRHNINPTTKNSISQSWEEGLDKLS